ncbi:MAG: hypothetical protein AB7F40_10290 [Victivallaceae bacterium]
MIIEKKVMKQIALKICAKVFDEMNKPLAVRRSKMTFYVRKKGYVLSQINTEAEVKRRKVELFSAIIDRPILDKFDLMDGEIFDIKQEVPELEKFWKIYEKIHMGYTEAAERREMLNHSNDPAMIAINLPQMEKRAQQFYLQFPDRNTLTDLFKYSCTHKLIGYKTVRSAITGKAIACWVFDKTGDELFEESNGQF